MKLIFIRHGQTELNAQGRMHERDAEVGLDAVGRGQARKTALECKRQGVEHLYSSPELRAKETAAVIADELKADVTILDELRERDWGDWTDRGWTAIQADLQGMSLHDRYTFVPPKGESWEQMDERLNKALTEITSGSEEVVGIVVHAGALRAAMPILEGLPKEHSFKYDFKNASLTIFDFDGDHYTKITEDDTRHLDN